jgi:hypothetical protein
MKGFNMILDTKAQIDSFRLSMLCHALRLEMLGMKRRGQSVYSIVKSEFGLKGDRDSVYRQLLALRDKSVIEARKNLN